MNEKRDYSNSIGKRLKEIRQNLGLTQEQFAENMDVSSEHYRKIERGATNLTVSKVVDLYDKLNVDPTYLLTGENNNEVDIVTLLINCPKNKRDDQLSRVMNYLTKALISKNK